MTATDRPYVVTAVKETPSGHFEVCATLLSGPGHRTTIMVPRHQWARIDELVRRHVNHLRLPLPARPDDTEA